MNTVKIAVSLLWLLVLFGRGTEAQTLQAAAPDKTPHITFTVSMPRPNTHLLQVEMRVRGAGQKAHTDLVMPVWTPGSYLVREYARHVQDFAAADEAGKPLPWRKVNKNTWRIETGSTGEWRAAYRVYANDLTVRTNDLDDRHAFWNNAALLMYVEGQLRAPATLKVVPPPGWEVATGLPAVSGQAHTFYAANFDVLYDAPVLAGTLRTIPFTVRGIPHRIVIDGDGNYDGQKLRRDVQKVAETTVGLLGEMPYRDYTFLVLLHSAGGGGLEHANSTALEWRRFGFRAASEYQDFLGLVAHEFFHAWNVKQIRPDALGPFDYTRENYTRLLWVAEGLTSYYAPLLLRRAGLLSDREYLTELARSIEGVQQTPGRHAMSAEEASFDAWIEYYRPDENSVNASISYYAKGELLGLLLDLAIRKRAGGKRSLDDVMRTLYTQYAKKGRNYTPEDFQRVCEQAAGQSLADFFSRYVRGREELPYDAALEAVGLRLETAKAGEKGKPPAPEAYLGAALAHEPTGLTIRAVPSGTPAYDQGLSAGDQIIAIDGARVTLGSFNARLEEKKPGDVVRLTLFRGDDLRTLDITLGGRVRPDYRVVPVSQPTPDQKQRYQGWLGAPFPKPEQPPVPR